MMIKVAAKWIRAFSGALLVTLVALWILFLVFIDLLGDAGSERVLGIIEGYRSPPAAEVPARSVPPGCARMPDGLLICEK